MPRKPKKSRKRKLSGRKFKEQFARIVGDYLVTLPPEEQDKRIHAAHRLVTSRFRAVSAKAQEADETREIPLVARTRE